MRRFQAIGFLVATLSVAQAQASTYWLTDLGTLGGAYSAATGINASGQVVGYSTIADERRPHAFISAPNGGALTDLGTLGGMSSYAYGINASGQVVGHSYAADNGYNHAFISAPNGGALTDLNSFINPSDSLFSLFTLTGALAINDAGQIAGNGVINGQDRAFLATPTPAFDPSTNPGKSTRLTNTLLANGVQTTTLLQLANGVEQAGAFDPTAPTYVITHGWQPTGNSAAAGWDFDAQAMPAAQQLVRDAVAERLVAKGVTNANILSFEWEGAYTGGAESFSSLKSFLQDIKDGDIEAIETSRQARNNADYAGTILASDLTCCTIKATPLITRSSITANLSISSVIVTAPS